MILTCPECETQYFAEATTIGSDGRAVKCVSCGHTWLVGADGQQMGHSNGPGAHETYRLKLRERRQRQSRQAVMIVWSTLAALSVALLAGLYIFRIEVVERWPVSASSYARLGLDVNRFGLDFIETRADRFFEGTTPILEVRGNLRNIRRRAIQAPNIRVDMLDEQGRVISTAYSPIVPAQILPGDIAAFAARIENPPYESFELDVSLVSPQSVQDNTL